MADALDIYNSTPTDRKRQLADALRKTGLFRTGTITETTTTTETTDQTLSAHASTHISTGTDVIASVVASGTSGLMTGSDKSKLDGIASGAEVNVNADWNSVAGDSEILNKPVTMPPSSHTHAATEVSVAELGTATYDDVQDYVNSATSAGRISGGVLAAKDATHITVTAVKCMIRTTNSATGQLVFADVAANTNLAIVADSTNYIYVDYNAGAPIIAATTDRTTINKNTQFVLGAAYTDGAETPHVVTTGMNVNNWATDEHSRIVECHRVQRASGCVVSETGTRNIAATEGVMYVAGVRQVTTAKDTSGTDKFTYVYQKAGGGWTFVEDQTQINNTQYDDGTGTLATLTGSRYGVHWVFILYDGDLYVKYGIGDYTLAQAQAAQLPGTLPDELTSFGMVAAKIIIQKSASSFNSVISAYTTTFGTMAPTDHNNLANLQGGATGNYYHFRKYTDVATAKAGTGADGNICYVVSVDTWYRYLSAGGAYAADDTYILITGDGGNTRWIGVAGQYSYYVQSRFNTSTGHDHDGSDSKKVSYSNLDSIPSTFAPSAHASAHISTGSDAIAAAVAGGASGLMTGTDKTKLDGIASGAEVNVNADWSSGSGDSQILNKPSTMPPDSHGNAAHSSTFITAADVTYGNLNSNSDVGTGADQVAVGNHTHTTYAEDVMGGTLQYVSDTSIKWGFLNNNQVTIHNGTSFRTVKLAAEPTLDHEANTMAGVAQDHDIVYDVFLLDDSDTAVSIICAKWAVSTEGASARTAAWDGVAGHYVVGDRVSHNSKYWACILANDHAAAKDPDTEPNYWLDLGAAKDIDSLVGAGLYQEDGVLVYGPLATGDTSFDGRKYRWVGVIRLYDDSGAKFKNLINYRSIGNYYNSVGTKVQTSNSTASWTYNTATVREFRAGTNQTRGHFVSPVTQYCQGGITGSPTVSSTGAYYLGLGIDTTTTLNTIVGWAVTALTEFSAGSGNESVGPGAHYITELESGPGAGTGTNYANSLVYYTGWLLPRL